MADTRTPKLETLCLHAGQSHDPVTFSRGVPIHRANAYIFKDTEHAANLFALKESGNIYTRMMNPTTDALEQAITSLEGGTAALALASGMSAIFYSVINVCRQGDEIISSSRVYGGTLTMFEHSLSALGIHVHFVDPFTPETIKSLINDKTRMLYCETITNPTLDVTDLEAVAEVAKQYHLPLVVDSTFTTPYLLRPFEHGADIVIHSLTKWIGGHGTCMGGIVVDSGRFDWSDPKFTLFNEPDESYHGLCYAKDLGDAAPMAFVVKMRVGALRNLGACLAPDNAWMLIQGVETLALRMQRHCENAAVVAETLKRHPSVEWVRYPGLPDDPAYAIAKRLLLRGFGGMVVFGIKGGREAGSKFINALKMFSHVANVGDAKSLAIHPASTTHSQLTKQQLKDAGVAEDLIRLSIGIEHIDDILDDLNQALAVAEG